MPGPAHFEYLKKLLKRLDNTVCADCSEPNPRYASVTHGCFLCDECFGSHRAVGAHVSKTRSLALDEWSADEVNIRRAN